MSLRHSPRSIGREAWQTILRCGQCLGLFREPGRVLRRLLLQAPVCAPFAAAAGRYFEVECPASAQPDGLQMAVTYTLWLPENVARERATGQGERRRRSAGV